VPHAVEAVHHAQNEHSVLISSRWVLTAAHVAEALIPFDLRVRFKGSDYAVEKVIIHPD
jgi:hypothetical protein